MNLSTAWWRQCKRTTEREREIEQEQERRNTEKKLWQICKNVESDAQTHPCATSQCEWERTILCIAHRHNLSSYYIHKTHPHAHIHIEHTATISQKQQQRPQQHKKYRRYNQVKCLFCIFLLIGPILLTHTCRKIVIVNLLFVNFNVTVSLFLKLNSLHGRNGWIA